MGEWKYTICLNNWCFWKNWKITFEGQLPIFQQENSVACREILLKVGGWHFATMLCNKASLPAGGKRLSRYLADAGLISDEAPTTVAMLTDRVMRLLNIICTKLLFALRECDLCGKKLTSNGSLPLQEILSCFSSKTQSLWICCRYMKEGRPEVKSVCAYLSRISTLQRPACSPNLARSHNHSFPTLKEFLVGRRFESDEEVKDAVCTDWRRKSMAKA